MRYRTSIGRLAACAVLGLCAPVMHAQTAPISLQGRLTGVASGEYDFSLTIWDAPTGGTAIHTAATTTMVDGGLFTLLADVPASAFAGNDVWWSVSVDGGEPTERLRLAAVPLALTASDVGGALRVVRTASGTRPNVVGGEGQNLGDTASAGAIGGGFAHTITGGFGVTIAGGIQNTASGPRSFIGGGSLNAVSGQRGVVVGGDSNVSGGDYGFVGGGTANELGGQFASLLGGRNNRVAGDYSVVLGGRDTGVFADYGLAYGNQAVVNHRGGIVFSVSGERFETTDPNQFLIDAPGGVGIGTNAPQAALDVRGTTRTGVLVITGGSDLAEPFPASPGAAPEPGMVLSIDPTHPGALRVSREPYDTKVAGVFSGGNGLNTGMLMGQDGCDLTTAGVDRLPLAMTGRVWVFADDSNGAIRPGDRLTTSGANAGYAARVADSSRADGAVIGKAMTGIDEATGMVLVLVNLQ